MLGKVYALWAKHIRLHNTAAQDDCLIANVAISAPGGDGKVMIAPFGEYPHRSGMQVLDRAALERVLNRLNADGRDVVIDWGHDSFSNPKAEAAGWMKAGTFELRNDGLYATVEWTGEAKLGIEAKKYRFLSPVFMSALSQSRNGRLHIASLINAGITNNPNIPAMKPLTNTILEETETMKELLELLANALGLKDATQEAILNALTKMKESADGAAALQNRLDAFDAAFPDMKGMEGTALQNALLLAAKPAAATDAEVVLLKNRLAALEGKDLAALVNDAVATGKLPPAQKDWAMKVGAVNRPLLEEHLKNAVAFTGGKEMEKGALPAAGAAPAEAQVVFNQLGLDEKGQLKNTKKEEEKK